MGIDLNRTFCLIYPNLEVNPKKQADDSIFYSQECRQSKNKKINALKISSPLNWISKWKGFWNSDFENPNVQVNCWKVQSICYKIGKFIHQVKSVTAHKHIVAMSTGFHFRLKSRIDFSIFRNPYERWISLFS